MSFLMMLGLLVVGLLIIALPVKMAAAMMDAERTGFGWCLLALAGATLLQGLGSLVPVIGNIVAFLLGAYAFAAILGTDYLRGIGIAILHVLFMALMALVAFMFFGVSLMGLAAL